MRVDSSAGDTRRKSDVARRVCDGFHFRATSICWFGNPTSNTVRDKVNEDRNSCRRWCGTQARRAYIVPAPRKSN
jgi:hypothetical protein